MAKLWDCRFSPDPNIFSRRLKRYYSGSVVFGSEDKILVLVLNIL